MKQVLSSLGMSDLFDKDKADLSGMGKDLHVSGVFKKAFIDVNEEGTEAASSTWDGAMVLSDDTLPQFQADHPFFFMIWDHRLNVPLFIGRLTNPNALYPSDL
jgi:serpin B